MLKNFLLTLIMLCSNQLASSQNQIQLATYASNLTSPVAMDSPKDGTRRIFICEQTGKIKVIKNGKVNDKPFLDLSNKLDQMGKAYSEKGLLGIAFHPKYKSNGRFFVYYSAPASSKSFDHTSIIAEYKISADPDIASTSEKIIMKIDQPESNHNGGQLAFGPDGFLYIGSGDGGGGGDEHGPIGNGQYLNTLLGKILRIDIDSKSPYSIPSDNPFVRAKNARAEIWAYGLRNPWRFSFDRKTGKLFCADVGQNKWEEVDIIEKGKNYGWRVMEGNHCYNPSTNCKQTGLVKPIAEYGRESGISVTGGYVYNGKSATSLTGKYLFGDWRGYLYCLTQAGNSWKMEKLMIVGKKGNDLDMNINSFGEDESGEVYILAQKVTGSLFANGVVYRFSGGK